MRKYEEIEQAVSDTLNAPTTMPKKEYVWNAYKNGICITCDDERSAKVISSLIDKTQINVQWYTEQFELYTKARNIIRSQFKNELMNEFNLSQSQFDILYK